MGARRCLIRRLLIVTGAVACLPACHSTTQTTALAPDADFVSCDDVTGTMPYQTDAGTAPRMQVSSDAGTYLVKLLSNTFKDESGNVLDEAPAKGYDVWTIEVDAVTKAATATGGGDAGDDDAAADAAGVSDAAAPAADAAITLTPADGLTLSVSPWMPRHGHGTTPAAVTAAGAGTYIISPLNLYMAGYWEITISIADARTETTVADSAMLPICVPD